MQETDNLPKHIAFIMDGNRRWAKASGLPIIEGHRQAIINLRKIIEESLRIKIPYITLFAFSTENWNRSKEQLEGLFNLMVFFIEKWKTEIIEQGIKVKFLGDISAFSNSLRTKVEELESASSNNDKMNLLIGLNYGGRAEILRATQNILEDVKMGIVDQSKIDEKLFSNYLYTKDIPDPDLLIRTSGEYRVSNFLLWQIAYAELYFTKTLWPDFGIDELYKAIAEYQRRERRYGGN